MLKLKPIRSEKVWGYEDWIASTHKDGPQKEFVDLVKDYPLLVKVIQANDTLSVQVHPDDELAVELEGSGSRGKTECWYVLDAKPGAKLVYGLDGSHPADEIARAISSNSLEKLLNQVEVHKGDFVYIPAGTVHAIGGGLRLMEVQQSCNITYRLYDWGRPRELHVEKSLKVLGKLDNPNTKADERVRADEAVFDGRTIKSLPPHFECPYFEMDKITVKGGFSFLAHETELIFISRNEKLLSVRSTSKDGTKAEESDVKEESIFAISPGEKVTLEGAGEVIRIKPVSSAN